MKRLRVTTEGWRRASRRRRSPAAFTLVELLAVLAIIVALVALLLPAVQQAREGARRTMCASHLRQLGLSAQNYHAAQRRFPASWVNGDESIAWGISLLPFMEQTALSGAWDETVDWYDSPNAKLVATALSIFKCPTAMSPTSYEYEAPNRPRLYGTNDYKGCDGAQANDPAVAHWNLTGWQSGVVSREYVGAERISDGLSHTLLLVESVGGAELFGVGGGPHPKRTSIWYPGDGAWVGRALSGVSPVKYGEYMNVAVCGVNCSNMYDYGPYSFHPALAQGLLCDGAVITLHESIDPAILAGLYSYQEAQLISER